MTKTKNVVQVAVGKVAAASRKTHNGVPVNVADGALEDARAELIAARLEVAIDAAFNPDPPYEPIRPIDRIRLADKLLGDMKHAPAIEALI